MASWWKWLGLAGLAGVAATGVIVARQERQRRAYTPDEVRERLHRRLEEAERGPERGAAGRYGNGCDTGSGPSGSPPYTT